MTTRRNVLALAVAAVFAPLVKWLKPEPKAEPPNGNYVLTSRDGCVWTFPASHCTFKYCSKPAKRYADGSWLASLTPASSRRKGGDDGRI